MPVYFSKIVFGMMKTIIDGPGSVPYKRISVSTGYTHVVEHHIYA